MADALTPAAELLGTGWTFPPRFNRQAASVVMSSGVVNVHECLWVLCSTVMGERIMAATYGTNLSRKVFDALTETLANDIGSIVRKAVLDWEPRIDVSRVDVTQNYPLGGELVIEVDYVVRTTNSRGNFVYRYYLNEATFAPPPM